MKKNTAQIEKIVGRRYKNLDLLKQDIESFTGKTVNAIIESETERFEHLDFMIDYEFKDKIGDVRTLFYLKDNGGNYYITEV